MCFALFVKARFLGVAKEILQKLFIVCGFFYIFSIYSSNEKKRNLSKIRKEGKGREKKVGLFAGSSCGESRGPSYLYRYDRTGREEYNSREHPASL